MSRKAMKMSLNAYDQTELELCEVCGWKAVIPDDGCLVCARQQIKPVAYVDNRIHGWPDCFVMEPDPPHTTPLYATPERAPVAWMHNMIAGVVVTHRPTDLNRHPERWTALVPIKTQLLGE